jgi:cytidine deaminase
MVNTFQIVTKVQVFDAFDQLTKEDQELLKAALASTSLSYAPYSNFNVGAALKLESGEIVRGANQENASYSLCLCAEQVALHRAAIQFPDVKIESMAVTAVSKNQPIDEPAPPCGACRQVLSEYEFRLNHPIRIILGNVDGKIYILNAAKDLLPLQFDPSFLISDSQE